MIVKICADYRVTTSLCPDTAPFLLISRAGSISSRLCPTTLAGGETFKVPAAIAAGSHCLKTFSPTSVSAGKGGATASKIWVAMSVAIKVSQAIQHEQVCSSSLTSSSLYALWQTFLGYARICGCYERIFQAELASDLYSRG